MEVEFLATIKNATDLQVSHQEYEFYITNKNFSLQSFLWNASLVFLNLSLKLYFCLEL